MNYLITEEFRNGLMQYLGSRPYNEVAQAMELLQGLQKAPEPDAA